MVGRVAIALSGFLVTVAGCRGAAPSGPTAPTPSVADPFAGATCAAVRAPREPELMAWDPHARAQLDKLRRQGVVAVRYAAKGCDVDLELLPGCVGPKNLYVYSPMSAADTRVVRTIDELLAQLPVGAPNVSMSLGGARVLRADFKVVGAAALPVGTTVSEYDLVGADCKKATHVVSAVYVGGFALAQAAPSSTENVFAGSSEALTREGFAPICQRSEAEGVELGGCSTPIRVALIPLNGEAPPPTCPPQWTFDGKRCVKAAAAPPVCSTWGGAGDGCATPEQGAASDGGAPEARAFDATTVERIVREKGPSARRTCWEAAPPSVHKVSFNIAASLSVEGRITEAEPQSVVAEGSNDAANIVARCIANEVKGWEFPPPDSPQKFQLPFHFLRQ